MSNQIPSARAQFLGRGIEEIQARPEFNRMIYWIFSSLEKFQKEIQDCRSRTEAFSKFMEFVDSTDLFNDIALYRVNEECEFVIDLCSREQIIPSVESFVKEQMKSGKFAWALKQNREVMVSAPDDLPGKQGILHAFSTRSTTLGMFVGFLKDDLTIELSTLSKIISLIVDSTVYVLENKTLENELIEHNRKLEKMVESRTEELLNSNQHLHQSNARLKNVNEKKSEFLGIVAHDLKNPLSGIIGLSQLIEISLEQAKEEGEIFDPDSSLVMLKQITESATEMAEALNQLMNSESIESGKIQLEPSVIDLGQVARKVVVLNNSQANAKEIQIQADYGSGLTVVADPLRLQEAIDNLVSNAIKYSPLGSTVTVNVWRKETSTAAFSVKDEGPGLSPRDKEKLFGRFQKLSPRPTGGESSTGLGLFIFKRLINLHNGSVWVNSEEGKGSEFGFDLPCL